MFFPIGVRSAFLGYFWQIFLLNKKINVLNFQIFVIHSNLLKGSFVVGNSDPHNIHHTNIMNNIHNDVEPKYLLNLQSQTYSRDYVSSPSTKFEDLQIRIVDTNE